MAPGEPLTAAQMTRIEQAIDIAKETTGLDFAAYVGALADGRQSAEDMLRKMPVPADSVLVAVDPEGRTVDVVTGPLAARWLDDNRCQLAILTMSSRFSVGDIAGGLHDGIIVMGEQAKHPSVHVGDNPD